MPFINVLILTIIQEPSEGEKEITVDDLVPEDDQDRTLIIDDWADEKSAPASPIPSSGTRTPVYTPPRKEVTFSRQPTVHVIETPTKTPTPPASTRQSSLMSRFNEMMTKKEDEKVFLYKMMINFLISHLSTS